MKTFTHVFAILIFSMLFAGVTHADLRQVPEDKVLRLTINLRTGEQVQGVVKSYDEIAFNLVEEDGKRHRISWTTIPAKAVDEYWRFFEEPQGDGEKLFELGLLLNAHRDGRPFVERAFAEAVEADPSLKEKAQAILDGADPGESFRRVGEGDPAMWGELDDELMQRSTDDLQKFSERVVQELRLPLRLYKSERFMVCTDLEAEQAGELIQALTATYRYAADLLGEDPDGNIFRGKCLILLFSKRVDYLRFQRDLHETDARGTGALCHGFGDGHVHIAAFVRPSTAQTQHVLSHELVHGMLHRYRSPVALPDWLNEGLAVHLSHMVVPPASGRSLYTDVAMLVAGKEVLGEAFFESENLPRSQYPVAGALAEYMIERNQRAMVRMLDGIKDGQSWQEAMQGAYRFDERRLALHFRRRLDRALNDRLGG